MNLSVQLIFVVLLSIANGNESILKFWYTGNDLNRLNCTIYSKRTNERPFDIDVRPFWRLVQKEYCKSQNGTVIKLDKNRTNELKCNQSNLRTLEINGW